MKGWQLSVGMAALLLGGSWIVTKAGSTPLTKNRGGPPLEGPVLPAVVKAVAGEIGPDKLNFGRILVGHSTGTRRLAVRNTGGSSYSITHVAALAPPFALTEVPTLPFLLAPGEMTAVGVEFQPTADGYFRTVVELDTDDPSLPLLTAEIGGRGIAPGSPQEYMFEDFGDMVTENDRGFNDFQGNSGGIEPNSCDTVTLSLDPDSKEAPGYSLRVAVDLSEPNCAFGGWFNSVLGKNTSTASLDFTNVFADDPNDPGACIASVDEIRFFLKNISGTDTLIKFELKNPANAPHTVRAYRGLPGTAVDWTEFALEVPADFSGDELFDYTQVKEFNLVVERSSNPDGAEFLIDNIRFVDNGHVWLDVRALSDEEVLELVERRAFQYYRDWYSRDPRSKGMIQDRGTFDDLLTVGATSPIAYAIAAERGWMDRAEAAALVQKMLQIFADSDPNNPAPMGTMGYRGFFYHFLDVDGLRKLNGDPNKPTVELSVIDTTLFLCSTIAAASYFDDPDDPNEADIRSLSREIWKRVDWPFMLEPNSNQFYWAWKPAGDPYHADCQIPDNDDPNLVTGFYSGKPGDPGTIDIYTDEAVLVCLLAIASPNPDHRVPIDVFYAWQRNAKECEPNEPIVVSYPGALFTYQFAAMFLDTDWLGPDQHPGTPLDLFVNSQRAIECSRDWSRSQMFTQVTYAENRWGPTANEDADDQYRSHGAPPIAWTDEPEENGTVAPYGAICSYPFVPDDSLAAIRHYIGQTDAWRHRFGWADAMHFDIGAPGVLEDNGRIIRTSGEWYNHIGAAIDMLPVLLIIENGRPDPESPDQPANTVTRLFQADPHIRWCALQQLFDVDLLAGDVDMDGDVDLSDLAALLGCYGHCVWEPYYEDCAAADFDCNGCVELSDLADLLGNYGAGT